MAFSKARRLANLASTSYAIGDDKVTAATIADNSVDIARLNVSDGSNGQALTTNGSGVLSFSTVSGGGGTPDDNTVTSAKIVNGTIVTADLADDAVTSAKIADDAITTALIADDAVTSALIADNTITVGNMAAGTLKTPGTRNIGIGASSLVGGSLTGIDNICIGSNTGENITDGDLNVFIGSYAGQDTTEADYSIGIGYKALTDLTTGDHNIGIGDRSLYVCTTGYGNVCVGNYTGYDITDGFYNTAVGYTSLYNNTGGDYNTVMGVQAGYTNTTGYNQVFIGGYAGYAATDGNSNTCVGYIAGYGITSGDLNICLGASSGRASSPSGNITTGDGIICLGDNSITNIYCADTSISSSDERDKADITDFTHGLSWIKKMRPVTYKWDKRSWYLGENEEDITSVTRDGSKKKSKVNIGLIAQEVLAIEQADSFSSSKDNMLVVNLNEDNTGYGIKYERIVPILINAIKELETRLAALEAA